MGILKEFVKANQFLNESKLSQFGTPEDLILTGKVTVAKDQYGNNEQDVSNVESMENMFRFSKFQGDISKWDVRHVKYAEDMFDNCPLENKPEFQPEF